MIVLRENVGVTQRDRIIIKKMNDLKLKKHIVDRIQQRKLRYFEHVIRMQDGRTPKIAIFGKV